MFLEKFDKHWAKNLGNRAFSFRKVFEYLLELKKDYITIIETGSYRKPSFLDGCSSLLFDDFINSTNGEFHTIDIDEGVYKLTKSKTSDKTTAYHSDSVVKLWTSNFKKPDLLYLDSFDLTKGKEKESAKHHLFELLAISNILQPHTLILVDDHVYNDKKNRYKGSYIEEFFSKVNNEPYIIGQSQTGWIWKR